MVLRRIVILAILTLITSVATAQDTHKTVVDFEQGEYWWGGVVGYGSRMPYVAPVSSFDLARQCHNNQVVPFFLSSKGRFLWSDLPFRFEVGENKISIESDYEKISVQKGGTTLREAYLSASSKYFPPSGTLPDPLFFTMPQYNTWIELMYDQNQPDILGYARNILSNGFPAGVLMVDDNWQKYYGNFDFKPEKFPDPRAMVDELHRMGFRVMLWVCPFVSPDSPEYRELKAKGYLVKRRGSNQPAIIDWWNGSSASYDFTNPAAKEHFIAQLKSVQERYGIDGFKFDAGDNSFYNENFIDSYNKDAISVDHTAAWAEIGLEFPFNEYRACWKLGGQPLVQRLGDKDYSWRAVGLLIPDITAAGLFGYSYTCPDMIGGGQYGAFLGIESDQFDQQLIVRSAQVHALMPMMQFSVAPWRILDADNLGIVKQAARLHERFGSYILECAQRSAVTGEPIVRHMEYSFPAEGFAQCNDQFMLGDDYLVAPVVTKSNNRSVKLPRGKWQDETGKVYRGGKSYDFEVPLSRLIYFKKVN